MGDYFRKVINEDDAICETKQSKEQIAFVTDLRETLRRGHFVSDELAIEVIKQARKGAHKEDETLILDGMPRTVK